jgi:hypothetical protein
MFNLLLVEFGSTKAISKALDLSNTTINNWRIRNQVPVRYLKTIEQLTEGRIKPFDLRPDLLPDFNRQGVVNDMVVVNAQPHC